MESNDTHASFATTSSKTRLHASKRPISSLSMSTKFFSPFAWGISTSLVVPWAKQGLDIIGILSSSASTGLAYYQVHELHQPMYAPPCALQTVPEIRMLIERPHRSAKHQLILVLSSLSASSSLSAFSGSNTICVEPPPKSSTAYGGASAGESARIVSRR